MKMSRIFAGLLTAVTTAFAANAMAAEPVQLSFWYPVDLGGGLAKVIDGLVGDFNKTILALDAAQLHVWWQGLWCAVSALDARDVLQQRCL